MLRVRTLGEVRLFGHDGEALSLRRAPLALLVYLARRAPRGVPRTELAALFWGDRTDERARQSLRQALLELKQAIGDSVEVKPDSVRVTDGAVALDVTDFEGDAKHGRHEAAAERWAGEFFPGAEDVGGDEFERWVESERVSLHRRLGTVMQQLIGAAELRSDWPAAATWAERWAAAVPLDERAHARLIEALRMDGRSAEAVERHAEFVARLRLELEVDPSPEFMRLATGLEAQARTETARRARPSVGVRAPTFVGRSHILGEISAACRAAASGTPAVVLLEDGGGCGKSRLLEELVKDAGGDALVLRASGRADAPYATARELLAPLHDAPGCAGAAPEALAEVARLVPALRSEFKYLPDPSGDEHALIDGLAQTLAAVGEDQLVLVMLDDAHDADAETRALLAGVASRLAGRVVMVFCAEIGAREPRAGLGTLLSVPGLVRIRLTRLAEPDVEAMLGSMVTLPDHDRAALASRIFEESRGVPVLVAELVAALVDEGLLTADAAGGWRVSPALEHRPLPLPVRVRERVGARLARLSPPARALVDAAAVIGTPADGVLLESVAGLSPDEFTAAQLELTARHIIREEDGRSTEIEFVHPIAPRVAYALLAPTARQALHARAAAEMAARDMTTTAERSALPFHLARAGSVRASAASVASDARGATPASIAATAATTSFPRRRLVRPALTAVAALLLIVALASIGAARGWWGGATAAEQPASARRVVVGAFQNRSSNPQLDTVRDVAVDWIVRGLDETGLVNIVGIGAGPHGQRSGQPTQTTDEALRETARAARAGTIVTGSLHQMGDSIEIQALVLDAASGTLLRALPPVHASQADPLVGVRRLRGQVVGAVAALLDSAYDAGPVSARPPPSYEAYLAFMRGEDAYDHGDAATAELEYSSAAAADPDYTLPVLRLAHLWFHTSRCARVDSVTRALSREARLSRFEGYYLARVQAWCRSDFDAASEAASRMAELAPRSQFAQLAAAFSAVSANRPREALRRLKAIDPTDGRALGGSRYWLMFVVAAHMTGDEEELRRAERALPPARRDLFTVGARAYAAGALGNPTRLERAVSEMFGRTRVSSYGDFYLMLLALDELRAHGKAGDARELAARFADRAAALAVAGPPGDTARYMRAELLYRAGRYAEARAAAESLLVRHSGQWLVVGLAGRSAARMGDTATARRISATLAELKTPDMHGSHIFGRAQIAAILGEREEAVRLLRQSLTQGVNYIFENDISHVGHASVDLESLQSHPTILALLDPKG